MFNKINNCKTDSLLYEITHTHIILYFHITIFLLTKKYNFLDSFIYPIKCYSMLAVY